jgi:hypothetical protein
LSTEEEVRKKGFDIYCTDGAVRRITENISAVKGELGGYPIVEFKDNKWHCDCYNYTSNPTAQFCEHIYAAELARQAKRSYETEIEPQDEINLKC